MFNESEDIISENGMAYSPEIIKSIVGSIHKKIGLHCTYGEQNIKSFLFIQMFQELFYIITKMPTVQEHSEKGGMRFRSLRE